MHIWSLENIFIGHIYICLLCYLFIFMHYGCCICANECKLVQMHASLHIKIGLKSSIIDVEKLIIFSMNSQGIRKADPMLMV